MLPNFLHLRGGFTNKPAIEQSISDIVYILRKPITNNIPSIFKGGTITKAFQDVAVALHRYKSSPTITYLNTTAKLNPVPKCDTASLPRVEFP